MDLSLFKKFGQDFQPGQILFCEYETGSDFYLIQSGHVQISKIVKNIEKTMDILESGDILGEMAILEEQPRSATAIALDNVSTLRFNRENFSALMHGQPQLAFKLMSLFSKRIYDAKRRLSILLLDDITSKVADVFIMLTEKNRTIDLSVREVILNTHYEDISHWCGEPMEGVRNVLESWSRMGKIEISNDKITIKNINDFQRIVGSKKITHRK